MKTNLLLLFFLLFAVNNSLFAQNDKALPKGFAEGEKEQMAIYLQNRIAKDACAINTPPDAPIRSIAEWEEMQAIVVAWDSADYALLADIIRYARLECEVVVAASNVTNCQNQLLNQYGFDDLDNIRFIQGNYNSIWMRDYGGNPAYLNDVDSLVLVDWIYNRPRPLDDDLFCIIADEMGIPMYQTVTPPNDLVHTGGNYMTDGLGLAFSSRLLLEENDATNTWGDSNHTEEEIDDIMEQYLGIDEYIKMETLPWDGIHHIDMHMKLLDEETLLVGAYPTGVSDGPQIEANLAYIQQNYKTSYGTDFEIIRIDMPADAQGDYPGGPFGNSHYMTYANALFVNKTVLVPIYMIDSDETALAIWRKALPGYNIVGLDCRDIIRYSGAIHCITKEIGVADPLLITHQQHRDVENNEVEDYEITAEIQHRSGISEAILQYRTDSVGAYIAMPMSNSNENTWAATIPNQANGTIIQYYIEGTANSGKNTVRPLPAPEGFFEFMIDYIVDTNELQESLTIGKVFPNPASALTYVSIENTENITAKIDIYNVLGEQVLEIHNGALVNGKYNYFFDASNLSAGTYFIKIQTEKGLVSRKFVRG